LKASTIFLVCLSHSFCICSIMVIMRPGPAIQNNIMNVVLSHMFGYLEQKLLGRSRKSFFLNLIFSAVRNFKFRHIFCQNKKFCSVKSRFPDICCNTNFGEYWLSTIYFLGNFNETFRLIFVHAHLQMCQVSLKIIQK
jgi:hypothetical protein